jgi:hypothetical protein
MGEAYSSSELTHRAPIRDIFREGRSRTVYAFRFLRYSCEAVVLPNVNRDVRETKLDWRMLAEYNSYLCSHQFTVPSYHQMKQSSIIYCSIMFPRVDLALGVFFPFTCSPLTASVEGCASCEVRTEFIYVM